MSHHYKYPLIFTASILCAFCGDIFCLSIHSSGQIGIPKLHRRKQGQTLGGRLC